MKHMIRTAMAIAAICIAAGCASELQSGSSTASTPYMTQAVLKSFENVFDGSWSGVKVYIERNSYLPGDLKKVGMNPAEVVDSKALFAKFEYETNAPAIAVVDAWESSEGLIHTRITYSALKLKYARQSEKGGVFEHTFKRSGNKLILLDSSKSMD